MDVVVRGLVGHGRDLAQLGAKEPEHGRLLLALGLRDDDDGAIAAGVADQSEADAGIAGRSLDDDAAGAQQALLLGILDDGERGAVLDRAAGVEELSLAQDPAAGRLGGGLQLDQRRAADAVDETMANIHGRADYRATGPR